MPAAAGLVLLALLPTRLDTVDSEEASAGGRVDAWYSGIWMLLRNPVYGVGKGNFVEHHPLTAHNSFVLAFAELGLFGYFFWLSFVALSLYMVYRVSRPLAAPGTAGRRGRSRVGASPQRRADLPVLDAGLPRRV